MGKKLSIKTQYVRQRGNMRKLIINADDFGRHPAVNRAVLQGHNFGCITSASLMPSGIAFRDAIEKTEGQTLGVGVHFTLIGEAPVLNPRQIPSLTNKDGHLHKEYPQFIARFLQRRVKLSEVRAELTAQMDKVVACGIAITHIDSHQHLHVLPGIIDIVLDIAEKYNVRALRIPAVPLMFTGGYPYKPAQLIGRSGLLLLAKLAAAKAKKRGFKTPDHFFGIVAGDSMREDCLLQIIKNLPNGISEVMVHPGDNDRELCTECNWSHHFEEELYTVVSPRISECIRNQKIILATFQDIT